ncbi:MAG: urease accessory protein UreE [Spirulinaceae cyanobacterium]
MLTLTQRLPSTENLNAAITLFLTAEKRTRSRHRFEMPDGQSLYLRLPRGTILQDGDLLLSEAENVVVRVEAQPEPVITVRGKNHLDLLRAAYHLGNRHVPLEITTNYLRLNLDSVLFSMLLKMGLDVQEEVVPFYPEVGAYNHNH